MRPASAPSQTLAFALRLVTCAHCSLTSLRDLRRQIQHFCIDRDEQVYRASRALESVAPARIRRADVASHQQILEDLQVGLVKLRKENDKSACALHFHPQYFI